MRRAAGRPRLAAALLAIALSPPGLARAQGSKDVETARALFVEASRLAEQGRWADARDRYTLSLRLRRSAITLYSLGVVDKEFGLASEARESFRAFLDSPSTPGTSAYEEPARRAIAAIDQQAASAPPAASAQPAPDATAERPDPVLPLVMIGAGSALFAAGLVTGLLGLAEASAAPARSGPDADAARAKGIAGDVLATTGIAAAAVGVIVLLVQRQSAAPLRSASVRPWIGGTTAGIVVSF